MCNEEILAKLNSMYNEALSRPMLGVRGLNNSIHVK